MKIFYKAINMTLSMFTVIPLPKYEWDAQGCKAYNEALSFHRVNYRSTLVFKFFCIK